MATHPPGGDPPGDDLLAAGRDGQFAAVTLNPGVATGPLLALDEPLSFWGGTDETGLIIDAHHPQHRARVTGTVLAMRAGRGSSSSSYVLAEQLRTGAGPAAIVLAEADAIIALGAIVGFEMYGLAVPVVQVAEVALSALQALPPGLPVCVEADATADGAARVTLVQP